MGYDTTCQDSTKAQMPKCLSICLSY